MSELPPISNEFSTIIASREFELSHRMGIDKVTVEIGSPINDVQTVVGYDWRCPVRITVGTTMIIDQSCGCDSFQALNIAMDQLVKIKLESIAQEKNATLLLYGKKYSFEHKY